MGSSRGQALLCVAGGIILAQCVWSPLFSQSARIATNSKAVPVSVPFVGCASSGQLKILEAPKGTSRSVQISSKDAQALAYYKSADGLGLLAPRGWYCEGVSGSGGYALFLSKKPINHDVPGWHSPKGPSIEVNHMTSSASGKYEIAEIMARVFPAYRAFATSVMEGVWDRLPPGSPFPKDTLIYRGKNIVEYTTPAQTEGLGNFDSWLGKTDLPISGAAVITGDPPNVRTGPDLVLLSVRLLPALTRLIPIIIDQFERDTVRPPHE